MRECLLSIAPASGLLGEGEGAAAADGGVAEATGAGGTNVLTPRMPLEEDDEEEDEEEDAAAGRPGPVGAPGLSIGCLHKHDFGA